MHPSLMTCKSRITNTARRHGKQEGNTETVKDSDVHSMVLVCFVTTGPLFLSAAF